MTQLICAQCGGANVIGSTRCWLCHGPIDVAQSAATVAGPSRPLAQPGGAGRTFQLSSLMLAVAMVALFLGLFREAPGLAVLLLILGSPALARTWIASSRQRAMGQPMTLAERWIAFAGSLAVVTATGVAALAAFAALCFGSAFLGAAATSGQGGEAGLSGLVMGALIGAVLGFIAAGYVIYRFVRWLWPIKSSAGQSIEQKGS